MTTMRMEGKRSKAPLVFAFRFLRHKRREWSQEVKGQNAEG